MVLYVKVCDLLEREGNFLFVVWMYKMCWLICLKLSGLFVGRELIGVGIVLMELVFKLMLNFEFII